MTTAAPLPRLRDLAAALVSDDTDDAALARPWLGDAATPIWLARSAWSLAALAAARRAIKGGSPRLWLPDYFCNQSTAPLRETGAELAFYPIGQDLTPDWTACRRMAETGAPDLFVLVHYFGAATPTAEAATFCRQQAALLIEDAAHVLAPSPGIGEAGDAVMFSPHKLLPVPDGALLLVKGEQLSARVAEACYDLGTASPSPATWLIKRLIQIGTPDAVLRRRIAAQSPAFTDDPRFEQLPRLPRPSAAARRLLASLGRTLPERTALLRRHALELTRIIDKFDGLRLFPQAEAATAPYRFVIEARDTETAAQHFAQWRRRGIPVETWPDLPPEVTASPDSHRTAIDLRRRLLFLPLHQPLASSLSAIGS